MKVQYTDEQTNAMQRLYGQFVRQGDLVFNVGANMGTRTQIFLDLGARVIAVEPQEAMCDVLRRRFAVRDVRIIQAACGPTDSDVELHLCTDNQLATCAPGWAESLQDRWSAEKWQQTITVRQITLDWLVESFGYPSFVKIDVEGYEREVLKGMNNWTCPCLCFEATIPYVEPAIECVEDLAGRIGYDVFNYIVQEHMELRLDRWVPAERMIEILRTLPESTFYIDVFAR